MGILASAVALLSATAVSTTEQISIRSEDIIEGNFRGPFDLLVLPGETDHVALDPLGDGVLRSNYLSGIAGTIPWLHVDTIAAVEGVQIAAPLAIAGTTLFEVVGDLDLSETLSVDVSGTYLVETGWVSDGGLSVYPNVPIVVHVNPSWNAADGCPGSDTVRRGYVVACLGSDDFDNGGYASNNGERATFGLYLYLPVVIAVVDPVSEAQLTDSSFSLLFGTVATLPPGEDRPSLPALFSSIAKIDTFPRTTIHQLADPLSLEAVVDSSLDSLRGLDSTEVSAQDMNTDDLYRQAVFSAESPRGVLLLEASSVEFHVKDTSVLRPVPVDYSTSAWTELPPGFAAARPPGNEDVQFRSTDVLLPKDFDFNVVGTFDISPDAADIDVQVGVYDTPVIQAPDGTELGPTMNIGGYLQQPPTALITRESAEFLFRNEVQEVAPSSIRIRVDDQNATPEGVAAVAEGIRRSVSGVTVVSVSGTTVVDRSIYLEGNQFGRASATFGEEWIEGGTALRVQRGLAARESLTYLLMAMSCSLGLFILGFLLVQSQTEERKALQAAGCPPFTATRILSRGTSLPYLIATLTTLTAIALAGFEVPVWPVAVGVLGGAGMFGLGVIFGLRRPTGAIRFRFRSDTLARLAITELLNRPTSWRFAVLLLGVSASVGGLLLQVHSDLTNSSLGNGVALLTTDLAKDQLVLIIGVVGLAILVVFLARVAVRLSDPSIDPREIVGWNRSLFRRLVGCRVLLVGLTSAVLSVAIQASLAGLFSTSLSVLTTGFAGGIAFLGSVLSES